MIDGVFNWSKSIQSESIKRNWFAKSKNILTGHPKYDIYFKLKNEFNFSNKNNILLFTSFTLANPRLASRTQKLILGLRQEYKKSIKKYANPTN